MLGKSKRIYLDYAAATPIAPDALKEMYAVARDVFANPHGIHSDAVRASEVLEKSRQSIGRFLECKSRDLVFVSGGTEANNLAIRGVVEARRKQGVPLWRMHIVVSAIEHASVLEPVRLLEREGVHVTYLAPDEDGYFNERALVKVLRPETVLVSIGWANSEIGTVQSISSLSRVVKTYATQEGVGIYFHSDAGQAPLYESGVVAGLGVDLLTLDSGKMYGPRGVGVVYVAPHVFLDPSHVGGGQESGLRAGTPPVALAAGMARALEWVKEQRARERSRLSAIRAEMIAGLTGAFPGCVCNGGDRVLPHIVNVSIPGIDAEYVVLALDHNGVAVSTKSSCQEKERVSYVVQTLGGEEWRAMNTIRFSMGVDTTSTKVLEAITKLSRIVKWE